MSPRSAIVLLWVAMVTACSGDDHLVPPAVVRPPFNGTIFIDPDIITDTDPTTFTGLVYSGHASREMFDRRVNTWVTLEPSLFDATFRDGLKCRVHRAWHPGGDAGTRGRTLVVGWPVRVRTGVGLRIIA